MKRVLLLCLIVACTRSKEPNAAQCNTGGSCSKEGETCSPAPIGSGWSHALQCNSGKWTELEIAPLPTPASATASASPQGRAQPVASARTLPKLELSCNTDADCIVTTDEIQDDAPRTYACCAGCVQRAGSAAWYKSFQAACAAQPAPMCPPIGCAMSVLTPACRGHRCEMRGK